MDHFERTSFEGRNQSLTCRGNSSGDIGHDVRTDTGDEVRYGRTLFQVTEAVLQRYLQGGARTAKTHGSGFQNRAFILKRTFSMCDAMWNLGSEKCHTSYENEVISNIQQRIP